MTQADRYTQFASDMVAAGYTVEQYHGRFFYHGPAVRIEGDALQDAIRATAVKVQWDQLGMSGLIVYPQ